MAAENSAFSFTGINYISKYIKTAILNWNIFNKANAVQMSIRDFRNIQNLIDPRLLNGSAEQNSLEQHNCE